MKKRKFLYILPKISFLLERNEKVKNTTNDLKKEYFNAILGKKRGFLIRSALIFTVLTYIVNRYVIGAVFTLLSRTIISADPFNTRGTFWAYWLSNYESKNFLESFHPMNSYTSFPSYDSYRGSVYYSGGYPSSGWVIKPLQQYREFFNCYGNTDPSSYPGYIDAPTMVFFQNPFNALLNSLIRFYTNLTRFYTARKVARFSLTHMMGNRNIQLLPNQKLLQNSFVEGSYSRYLADLYHYHFSQMIRLIVGNAYKGYLYCANKTVLFDFGLNILFKIASYRIVKSFMLRVWSFFFIKPAQSILLSREKIERFIQFFEECMSDKVDDLESDSKIKSSGENSLEDSQSNNLNFFELEAMRTSLREYKAHYNSKTDLRPSMFEELMQAFNVNDRNRLERSLKYEAKIFGQTSQLYYNCFLYYCNLYQRYLSRSLAFITQYNQYNRLFEALTYYRSIPVHLPSKTPLMQTIFNRHRSSWVWVKENPLKILFQKSVLISTFIIELYTDTTSCAIFFEADYEGSQLPSQIRDQHKLKALYKGCVELFYEFISKNPFLSIYITRSQWDASTFICPLLKRCVFGKSLNNLYSRWSTEMDILNLYLHRNNVSDYDLYLHDGPIIVNESFVSLKKSWAYFINCFQTDSYWKEHLCYLDEKNRVQYRFLQDRLYYYLYKRIYFLICVSFLRVFFKQMILRIYIRSSLYYVSTDLLSDYRFKKENRFSIKKKSFSYPLLSSLARMCSKQFFFFKGLLLVVGYLFFFILFFISAFKGILYILYLSYIGFWIASIMNRRYLKSVLNFSEGSLYNLEYRCSDSFTADDYSDYLNSSYLDSKSFYSTQPTERDANFRIYSIYKAMQKLSEDYEKNLDYLCSLAEKYTPLTTALETDVTLCVRKTLLKNPLSNFNSEDKKLFESLFKSFSFKKVNPDKYTNVALEASFKIEDLWNMPDLFDQEEENLLLPGEIYLYCKDSFIMDILRRDYCDYGILSEYSKVVGELLSYTNFLTVVRFFKKGLDIEVFKKLACQLSGSLGGPKAAVLEDHTLSFTKMMLINVSYAFCLTLFVIKAQFKKTELDRVLLKTKF